MKVDDVVKYWNNLSNEELEPDVMEQVLKTIDCSKFSDEFILILAYTRYQDFVSKYVDFKDDTCVIVSDKASVIEKLNSIDDVNYCLLRDINTIAEIA